MSHSIYFSNTLISNDSSFVVMSGSLSVISDRLITCKTIRSIARWPIRKQHLARTRFGI